MNEMQQDNRNIATGLMSRTTPDTWDGSVISEAFRIAAKATDTEVLIYDSDKQTIYLTEDTAAYWGISTAQAGVPYDLSQADMILNDSRQEYIRIHEEMIRGAEEASGKVGFRHPSGEIGFYDLTFSRIHDAEGNPTSLAVGAYRNITQYQEDSNRQYRIAKALSQGIATAFLLDLDKDQFKVERLDPSLRQVIVDFIQSNGTCYSKTIDLYCQTFVREEDQERMIHEFQIDTIKRKIAEQSTYSVRYRVKENSENQGFFELRFSNASAYESETQVLMSYRCIDEEVLREHQSRQLMEQALDQSEKFARRAEENLAILNDIIESGLWYIDFDESGEISRCFWSDDFRRMLGFENENEFPNNLSSWSNRLHPSDRARILSMFWGAVQGRNDYDVTYRIKNSKGSYYWVRSRGKVVRYPDTDLPRLFLGTFIDITATHEKERVRAILDSIVTAYVATWVIDLQSDSIHELYVPDYVHNIADNKYGTASYAMRVFAEKFTLNRKDANRLAAFLDVATLQERIGDQHVISTEYESPTNGWTTANIVVCERDQKGRPSEVVLALSSIDKEKRTEIIAKRALEEAYEAVNKANSAKTEFLSRMSHDIRTPMNAIIGMTAIASAHANDPDRVQDCLSKIVISSKHLLSLINEVLDMSRIDAGNFELHMESFSLPEMVDAFIAENMPEVRAKHHNLEVNLHDIQHEDVVGDYSRLSQVFNNILGNAITYTPDGGEIRVDITECLTNTATTTSYEFVIEDNGVGMSEEFLTELFDPFARAEDPRIAHSQGAGLGMPIALNIVRMMDGSIKVESELDKGTKVKVKVFLGIQDHALHTPDEALIDLPVLLADDDEAIRIEAENMLKEIGMLPEVVEDGSQAVKRVAERHAGGSDFFAVILDWKMPGMDGLEAARRIRQEVGDSVPILIISAYDWSDIEQQAREVGVSGFIAKPLFKSRMISLLKTLVDPKLAGVDDMSNALNALAKRDYSGKRVLLVEDNLMNAEMASAVLEMAQLSVELAHDGREAVTMMEACEDGYYDMVFMDIQMPHLNGYEATEAIRNSDREYLQKVPIVAMSAEVFPEDIAAATESGMNEHLAKPIELNRLLESLNRWL